MVTVTNGFVSRLARLGLPLGPNLLLTVRGRKSGTPHTTPVAIIEVAGKRWVQSPFGEVQWTRNLRAAGEATLTKGRRTEHVTATRLTEAEAATFYRDILGPDLSRSLFRRVLGRALGLTALVADPEAAAATHAVFELHPA
jgi:deazaflavin-dependent oxidoreductase (nitroreductase family)